MQYIAPAGWGVMQHMACCSVASAGGVSVGDGSTAPHAVNTRSDGRTNDRARHEGMKELLASNQVWVRLAVDRFKGVCSLGGSGSQMPGMKLSANLESDSDGTTLAMHVPSRTKP